MLEQAQRSGDDPEGNICLLTDSYKPTQWPQYPPGTTKIYSYFESRGGKWPETVMTGLQPKIQMYLAGENRVTARDVVDAYELYADHFGNKSIFNRAGWEHIVSQHSGKLPISIKAVPEGTVVPTHNILFSMENTCPECYWLTNYLETLLVQTWYPITVATQSREIKRVILKYLTKNGDPSLIDFKLHDFGFRGTSSPESARIGGAAHLTSFKGTDTVPCLPFLKKYYGCRMAGFSIPASEHSTITSWGREHEIDAFRNMLEKFPTGLMACVSDSFDIFKACTELWGGVLKGRVLERDGILIVRPDSGTPREIVLEVCKRLGDAFGTTYNAKGYKLLHPKVRVIQGDGVNIDSIDDILRNLDLHGWSADNVAFGMGGALLQKLDRDTQKMAFKCSYIEGEQVIPTGFRDQPPVVNKWDRDVFKEPVTDPGKNSKRGILKLVERGGNLYTEPARISHALDDKLVEVFRDGDHKVQYDLESVRERAKL